MRRASKGEEVGARAERVERVSRVWRQWRLVVSGRLEAGQQGEVVGHDRGPDVGLGKAAIGCGLERRLTHLTSRLSNRSATVRSKNERSSSRLLVRVSSLRSMP